jgi:putative membrane protein
VNPFATAAQLLADTDWGHMDGGGWALMAIGMLVFWGLVILGVVWLVRELSDRRSGGPREDRPSALEVLDHKLAEGVISVEDYRQRRELLSGDAKDVPPRPEA